ncbi:MAG: glycosyltransferase family 4 protein [Acidobacteria bacterium]|nr:glycosyltransferase family 4 protein [Acidobacteriota bacterium]
MLSLFGARVIFGAERENIEVLSALREKGIEVLCLVRHEEWNREIWQALESRGLTLARVQYIDGWLPGWRLWILLRNPIAFLVGNIQFLRHAWRFRPTHLHAFNNLYVLSFLPALLLVRQPVIYRCGDKPVAHRMMWRLLWRVIVRRSARFLAVSRFIAEELVSSGAPRERVEILYPRPPRRKASVAHEYPRRAASDREFHIVFVGQITEVKGPHLLVEAFRRVAPTFPRVRLTIAGRISDWRGDDWARRLRDDVYAHKSEAERISFPGFIEDVAGLLSGCDLLVAPSLIEEALGLVVLEAKEAGIPAVVFPSGGLPEMIDHGLDGWVCPEKSVDALVDALLFYLSKPGEAARQGTAALESLGKFGAADFADRCIRAHWLATGAFRQLAS